MTGINQKGRYGRYLQLILTCIDFLIINIAFFITAQLTPEFVAEWTRTVWLLANISYAPAAYLFANPQTSRIIGIEDVATNSLKAALLHGPIFISGLYFLHIDDIPLIAFIEFYSILFVLLPLWWTISRIAIKKYRRRGKNFSRIIIVGSNPTANHLYETLSSDVGFGYSIMGIFDDEKHPDTPSELYRGTLENIEEYVAQQKIDEIFCALPSANEKAITRTIRIAENNVAQYYYIPQMPNIRNSYDMLAFGTIPATTIRHQPLSRISNRFAKRIFDILFAGTFLIFFPLILIPVGIAIKISSPGPIFFKQKRSGYRGRDFYCYKFRTMKVNADADTRQATKDDPRKTRLGDFLRRTSIDELPQFINVLCGDMSVVGPRPHMLKHTQEYSALIDQYMVRHYIKPGITGWAQIQGYRGQTEELWQMERRVECDVWYIENWSTMLDIKIILRTIYNAIHGEKNAF